MNSGSTGRSTPGSVSQIPKPLAALCRSCRRTAAATAWSWPPRPAPSPGAELAALLDRLAFEAPDRAAIVAAATGAEDLARSLAQATQPSEIAEAASGAPEELVALAGALGPEPQAREWLEDLRHIKLEIDGADLLAAGVPQGPSIGTALRAALRARLDGRAHDRTAQLQEALRVASET